MAPNGPLEPEFGPEIAPSEMAASEPSLPRLIGTIGLGLVAVGAFAIVLNVSKERLIGPTMGAVFCALGLCAMLMHAARDGDLLVRRGYIGLGLVGLGVGAALSLIPKPVVGDWLLPWGVTGLLGGLFFATAAGRHEDEAPWTTIIPGLLGALGVGGVIAGLIGTSISVDYLARFIGVTLLGLVFWWAAVLRLGTATDAGYRLGQLLGAVSLIAIAWGIGRALIPGTERFFVPRGLVLSILGLLGLLTSLGLCSDRTLVTLTRRELAAYFYTPIGYLVLLGVAFIGWLNYLFFVVTMIDTLSRRPYPEPVVQFYLEGFFTVMVTLAVVPVICMRLVSEEKRSGTIEVLLTAPVSEWQVVLSKFIAALIYFLFLFVPWGLYLIPAYFMGRTGFDYLPVLSFLISLVCTGAALIATGLFCSTITKNQIIAAVMTFAFVLFYFLIPYAQIWLARGNPLAQVLDKLSFVKVWESSIAGSLQWHQLVTYLSLTVIWLFMSVKVLEARKWS